MEARLTGRLGSYVGNGWRLHLVTCKRRSGNDYAGLNEHPPRPINWIPHINLRLTFRSTHRSCAASLPNQFSLPRDGSEMIWPIVAYDRLIRVADVGGDSWQTVGRFATILEAILCNVEVADEKTSHSGTDAFQRQPPRLAYVP
jgi:hypothetical protein